MSQIHRQGTCPFFKCMSSFFKVLEYIKQSREELHFLSVLLFSSLSLGLLLCSFFLGIFLQPWKTLILVLLTRPKPWFLGRFLRHRAASRCIWVAFPRSRTTLLIIFMVYLLRSFGMPCRVAMSWAARCGVRPYVQLVAVDVWKLFVERTRVIPGLAVMILTFLEGKSEGLPFALALVRSWWTSALPSHPRSNHFPHLFLFIIYILEQLLHLLVQGNEERLLPTPEVSLFFIITHFRRTFDVH